MYSGLDIRFFRSDPNRLTASPPFGLHAMIWLAVGEMILQFGIIECISNNPVALRILACHYREVIWKCHAGKAGPHIFGRDAFCNELIECRGKAPREEIGSEAVERYDDSGRSEVGSSI